MSITEEILEADTGFTMHQEGEWDKEIFRKPGYTSFNDAGLECETGELLYGFVRVLQPENVLETGTHQGVGASYIGMGLAHNLKGHLDTIEFLRPHYVDSSHRIKKLGLQDWVTCHLGDAALFVPKVNYDLILLDTEPQTRFGEFIRYWHFLKDGGYLFIHDLHRHMAQVQKDHPEHPDYPYWPWGELPEAMRNIINLGYARPFHFPTPRGLTGFYKVHPDDYKWQGGGGNASDKD